MEEETYRLTLYDVRKLDFEIAVKNNISETQQPFNVSKRIAGKSCLKELRRRHSNHSLRTPEPKSLTSRKGFSKEKDAEFSNCYKNSLMSIKGNQKEILKVDRAPSLTSTKRNRRQQLSSYAAQTTRAMCASHIEKRPYKSGSGAMFACAGYVNYVSPSTFASFF